MKKFDALLLRGGHPRPAAVDHGEEEGGGVMAHSIASARTLHAMGEVLRDMNDLVGAAGESSLGGVFGCMSFRPPPHRKCASPPLVLVSLTPSPAPSLPFVPLPPPACRSVQGMPRRLPGGIDRGGRGPAREAAGARGPRPRLGRPPRRPHPLPRLRGRRRPVVRRGRRTAPPSGIPPRRARRAVPPRRAGVRAVRGRAGRRVVEGAAKAPPGRGAGGESQERGGVALAAASGGGGAAVVGDGSAAGRRGGGDGAAADARRAPV
jgi:hypothetical protein